MSPKGLYKWAERSKAEKGAGIVRYRNRAATKKTVAAMRAGGRLEGIDEAAVAAALTSAELLDDAMSDPEQPTYARAAAVRAHLAALMTLTGKEVADVDAGLTQVIAALSTPLGKPEV
jgi:hypothetical protein